MSEWISIKDELPSKSGVYWTFNGGDEEKTCIQQRVHSYDEKYKVFNNGTVTHWMELPDSPDGY